MSRYTTGEMAKLCSVSVRTVQYYDTRGLLTPSELSEGGRRLYSDEDLKKMKTICFLRDIGLPINAIARLFEEGNSEKTILLLLEQQRELLEDEMSERQEKLRIIEELTREIKNTPNVSAEKIGDIVRFMENKKKRRRVLGVMIAIAVAMELIETGTVVLWISTGIWWPFAVGMPILIALGIWFSAYYYKKTAYLCPECNTVFKPSFKSMFWAAHTPRTRKLTCSHCGVKSYCVEVYDENSDK